MHAPDQSRAGRRTAQAFPDYNSGLAGLNGMLGAGLRYADQTIYFPKVDWQINAKNHASFEANRLRFSSPGGQQTNATATYGLESFGDIYVKDSWGIAKLDSFITSNMSNEVRYQYGRDFNLGHNMSPTTPYENATLLNSPTYTNPNGIPPAVFITNGFNFGTPTFYNRPAYPDERRWQVSDTVQWTHGNHSIKFGEDYIHTYDLSENLTSVFGSYSYTSVANYLTDYYDSAERIDRWQKRIITPRTRRALVRLASNSLQIGLCVVSRRTNGRSRRAISLTLGVRYEFEQLPKPAVAEPRRFRRPEYFPATRIISPLVLGFAFDVFGTGNTVVRGGFGIFNARLINSTIYNALAQTGTSGAQSVPSVTPTQAGSPVFPHLIATAAAGPLPTVIYFDPNFKLPQVLEEDLNIEQNLGWNTVFTVSLALLPWAQACPTFVDTNLPYSSHDCELHTVNNNGSCATVAEWSCLRSLFSGYQGDSSRRRGDSSRSLIRGVQIRRTHQHVRHLQRRKHQL